MKKTISVYYLIIILILSFSACNSNKDKIIGRWKISDIFVHGENRYSLYQEEVDAVKSNIKENGFIDFEADGTLKIKMGDADFSGKWILIDPSSENYYHNLRISKEGSEICQDLRFELDEAKLRIHDDNFSDSKKDKGQGNDAGWIVITLNK